MPTKTKIKVVDVQFFWTHEIIDDMLRYDSAFACDKFPNIVAYLEFQGPSGKWGGRPTVDRWRSFGAGFNQNPMTREVMRETGISALVETMCTDGWYTYTGVYCDVRTSLYDYINKEQR